MTVFPATSWKVAASCSVLPCPTEPEDGETETLATGPAETAKLACPVWPAADAVTVALPTFAAFASPLDDTLTTALLELDHVTDCPLTTFPLPSVSFAESCCVSPATRLAEPGLTLTELTLPAATVSVDEPVAPPAAAVIVALPECAAVTRPFAETVAIDVLELDHATFSLNTLPDASVSLADSCCVPPLARFIELGLTATFSTAPADTTTDA